MLLSEVVDKMVEETEGDEEVTLRQLLSALDSRSYGPMLLIPAVLAIIPLVGGIPGVSMLTGALIVIVAIQAVFGQSKPWLPSRLLQFSFPRKRLVKGNKKIRPWVKKSESLIHSRLPYLTAPPYFQIIAVCCVLMGLLFFPLALLPMAVIIPAIAVGFFSLGLMARDGYLIVLGFMLTVLALGLVIWAA